MALRRTGAAGIPALPSPDVVVLDDRERASALDKALQRACGFAPKIERLHAGDILVGRRILIERKAVPDFAASILDGRLFSQIAALRASPFYPLLMLEGEVTRENCGKITAAALRGAILSVSIDWQVPVLRSKSVDDTAQWISAMLTRQAKGDDLPDWRRVTPNGQRRPEGAVPLRPQRRKVPTSESLRLQTIQMLSQIDGMSESKAKNLLSHFGSFEAVLAATPKELETVEGVGRNLSGRIHAVLHGPFRQR